MSSHTPQGEAETPQTDATQSSPRKRRAWGWIVVMVEVVVIVGPPLTITLVNDAAARSVETDLVALPLPDGAELLDSTSQAGKFFGNGNGMQYLGAILIRSDGDTSALQRFYDAQPEAVDLGVDVVRAGEFEDDLGRVTGFLDAPGKPGTFIVYGWGRSPGEFFYEFDLRGH